MTTQLRLDAGDFENLIEKMNQFGDGAVDVVTEVFHESGEDIAQKIDVLLPVSGRSFKGHSGGAKGRKWYKVLADERLSVTVTTVSSRNYLYFPDDGTTTRRHAGNQQFMKRGGEAAVPEIINKSLTALAEHFERV